MDELFGVLEELDTLLNSNEVVEESQIDDDDPISTAFESEDVEEDDIVEETETDVDTADNDEDDDDDDESEFDDDGMESLMIDDDM